MTRRLAVYMHEMRAGSLTDLGPGIMAFEYDKGYLAYGGMPLSLSLPPAGTASPEAVRNWFSNLLPEGDARDAVSGNARVALHDDFGLLEAIGRECAGSVSLWPVGEQPPPSSSALEYDLLDAQRLEDWIQFPRRRNLGREPLRLSLAGAQHKAVVLRFEDGTLALPSGASPSTHILKIPNPDWPGIVTLEALAMRTLAVAGLRVAEVEIFHASSPCLLITRYDRSCSGVVPTRIHQEDVCQALGISPERKYAEHGGPNLSDVFQLVREHGSEPQRMMDLTQLVIANAVLANADAHGKNLSLLLDTEGTVRLAPAYDVVPSGLFVELDRTMAMPIGNATSIDRIQIDDWDLFSREVGLRPSLVRSVVTLTATSIADALPGAAKQLEDEGADAAVIHHAVPWLVDRAHAIAAGAPLPPAPDVPRRRSVSMAWQ